ncbi:MAG: hypothetical protein ACYTXT_45540, partial [Nostoc sp.]
MGFAWEKVKGERGKVNFFIPFPFALSLNNPFIHLFIYETDNIHSPTLGLPSLSLRTAYTT